MLDAEADVAIVGGGLVGAAVAWGIARTGARVVVLDEGDDALRASRGNFALVWVQGKGLGMPAYANWTRSSAQQWPAFARILADETDIDVSFEQPGGFKLCLSERELQQRQQQMERVNAQPGVQRVPYEVLDHAQTAKLLPHLGPEVAGSIYSPLDGHLNSLRLLRALHVALSRRSVIYRPECTVRAVLPQNDGFLIRWDSGEMRARRIVLAAGLGNTLLAPMVGLEAPVRPLKGQIIVTEKVAPFLHYPISTVRQTDEGGVMIGDSQQDDGFHTEVDTPVISVMAARAMRMFPLIGNLNIVRTWAALRVMTRDGFPIYQQSLTCPGAFVLTCHSAVTLAAAHALKLAPAIAAGALPDELDAFGTRRFHAHAE